MSEKYVFDAVALFYLQKTSLPLGLKTVRDKILRRDATAIIPTIAVSELLWKQRREGEDAFKKFQIAYQVWKQSDNILVDPFDESILDEMVANEKSSELHDEIIAMTCKKHGTNYGCSNDEKLLKFWNLQGVWD